MGSNPSCFKGELDLPVEQVSWDDVTNIFLPKLSSKTGKKFYLPTEAEWEYACRAGSQTLYWFGDAIMPQQVNINSNATIPVKAKPANIWGLYQMHGNVFEWCEGSQRIYEAKTVENPRDGQDKDWRVLRGGAWNYPDSSARSAYRYQSIRTLRYCSFGFRFLLRSTES